MSNPDLSPSTGFSPDSFTISADQLPSNLFSVTFREPTFQDRREASKRFPSGKVGYAMEELLLALCLEGFNGEPFPPIPRDPIQSLRELPLPDSQFLMSTFMGMFTLDQELSDAAKALGLQMKGAFQRTYTIPKESMPLSSFSVTFRTPLLNDRMVAERNYPGADSNCGYSLEELLFAQCLIAKDGTGVEAPSKDIITLLDDWKHLDAAFAISVFINASTIDTQDNQNAKSLGKSLRKNKALPTKQPATRKSTPMPA